MGSNVIKNSLNGAEVNKKESIPSNQESEHDEAVISDEAKKLQEMEAEKQSLLQMLENSNEEAENSGFSDMVKALEIFRRIINGDNVPAEDEKFLMEYDSDMYLEAKTLAVSNDRPKNYDSLVGDDENGNSEDIEVSADNMPSSEESTSSSESSEGTAE